MNVLEDPASLPTSFPRDKLVIATTAGVSFVSIKTIHFLSNDILFYLKHVKEIKGEVTLEELGLRIWRRGSPHILPPAFPAITLQHQPRNTVCKLALKQRRPMKIIWVASYFQRPSLNWSKVGPGHLDFFFFLKL